MVLESRQIGTVSVSARIAAFERAHSPVPPARRSSVRHPGVEQGQQKSHPFLDLAHIHSDADKDGLDTPTQPSPALATARLPPTPVSESTLAPAFPVAASPVSLAPSPPSTPVIIASHTHTPTSTPPPTISKDEYYAPSQHSSSSQQDMDSDIDVDIEEDDADDDAEESELDADETDASREDIPTVIPAASRRGQRERAIEELVSTELSYASDMSICRDVFLARALGISIGSIHASLGSASPANLPGHPSPAAPFSHQDIALVFQNLIDVASFAESFAALLRTALPSSPSSTLSFASSAQDTASSHSSTQIPHDDSIGDIFLDMIPRIRSVFGQYCAGYDAATRRLQELLPTLSVYESECKQLSRGHTNAWDLASLLIKPVQRCLKYPLLLQAILSHTPHDHPRRESIRLAAEKAVIVSEEINEAKRRHDIVADSLSSSQQSRSKAHPSPHSTLSSSASYISLAKPFRSKSSQSTNNRSRRSRSRAASSEHPTPSHSSSTSPSPMLGTPIRLSASTSSASLAVYNNNGINHSSSRRPKSPHSFMSSSYSTPLGRVGGKFRFANSANRTRSPSSVSAISPNGSVANTIHNIATEHEIESRLAQDFDIFDRLSTEFFSQYSTIPKFADNIKAYSVAIHEEMISHLGLLQIWGYMYDALPGENDVRGGSRAALQNTIRLVATTLMQSWKEFDKQLNATVYPNLTMLQNLYKSPLTVLHKRDSLKADYLNAHGHSARGDMDEAARYRGTTETFIALSTQLMDELPQFLGATSKIFDAIVQKFSALQFSWLQTCRDGLSNVFWACSFVPESNRSDAIVKAWWQAHRPLAEMTESFVCVSRVRMENLRNTVANARAGPHSRRRTDNNIESAVYSRTSSLMYSPRPSDDCRSNSEPLMINGVTNVSSGSSLSPPITRSPSTTDRSSRHAKGMTGIIQVGPHATTMPITARSSTISNTSQSFILSTISTATTNATDEFMDMVSAEAMYHVVAVSTIATSTCFSSNKRLKCHTLPRDYYPRLDLNEGDLIDVLFVDYEEEGYEDDGQTDEQDNDFVSSPSPMDGEDYCRIDTVRDDVVVAPAGAAVASSKTVASPTTTLAVQDLVSDFSTKFSWLSGKQSSSQQKHRIALGRITNSSPITVSATTTVTTSSTLTDEPSNPTTTNNSNSKPPQQCSSTSTTSTTDCRIGWFCLSMTVPLE